MDMRDHSWHIENLYEQEPDIQVVPLHDALEVQRKLQIAPNSNTTEKIHTCRDKTGEYHSVHWEERDGDHRPFDGWSVGDYPSNDQIYFCPFCGTDLEKAKND